MLFSLFRLWFLTSSQIVQYQSLWRVGLFLFVLLQSQGYSCSLESQNILYCNVFITNMNLLPSTQKHLASKVQTEKYVLLEKYHCLFEVWKLPGKCHVLPAEFSLEWNSKKTTGPESGWHFSIGTSLKGCWCHKQPRVQGVSFSINVSSWPAMLPDKANCFMAVT